MSTRMQKVPQTTPRSSLRHMAGARPLMERVFRDANNNFTYHKRLLKCHEPRLDPRPIV